MAMGIDASPPNWTYTRLWPIHLALWRSSSPALDLRNRHATRFVVRQRMRRWPSAETLHLLITNHGSSAVRGRSHGDCATLLQFWSKGQKEDTSVLRRVIPSSTARSLKRTLRCLCRCRYIKVTSISSQCNLRREGRGPRDCRLCPWSSNPPTPRCGKCGGGVWEGAKPRVWHASEVQTDFNESSAELQTGFNESLGPFVVCWLLVCFLRPMWVVQWPLSDHVGRNSSCLACWWVVNWFQWQMCCLGVRRFSMTDVLPRRSEVFNDRCAALAFGGFDVGPSVCGGFVFDLFPAVRTGAFRADFVASKKVRFRWLPTGVLGVQRVR